MISWSCCLCTYDEAGYYDKVVVSWWLEQNREVAEVLLFLSVI